MLDATMFSLFSPQATAQAFGFAIDLGLKSLAIAAVALLLDRALSRRVLVRSAVLHASLLGLLLLPAAAMWLPQLKLNLIAEKAGSEWSPFVPQDYAVSRSETRRNAETRPAAATSPALVPAHELSPFARRKDAVSRSETRQNAAMRPAVTPVARPFNWRAVVLLSYAAVALAALLRLSRSLLAVASLKRSGSPLIEQTWTERLAHWRARLGVARQVRLLATNRIDVPVVIGWRRPAILAPERLAAADVQTIDAILLHELAHVRRGDYGWNLLFRIVQAFYWANPLLWLVGRALARVREQACDETCIHWLGGSEGYRATLVELAARLLDRPLAALGMAMARGSRLQRRLAQIDASRGLADCQSRCVWRLAGMVVVVSITCVLGALKITGSSAAADEPKKTLIETTADEKAAANPVGSETSPPAEAKEEKPKASAAASPAKAEYKNAAKADSDEPLKVRVEKVRREDFVVQTSQRGLLKPSRSMELYARVAGLIVARRVNVGDVVQAGQALAEIDAPELDAELEQAKASAQEAPAAVEQAQGKLDEALAGVESAQARVVRSEAELSLAMRNKEPVPIPKAQLAAAKAEVKQAEAAVTVAKAGLRIAQLHLTAAQEALKRVDQRAAYRQITAPAEGVVVRQAAEPGSFAKLGGEPLFVISGMNVLTMQTQISERNALCVSPGQHAQIRLDAEGDGKPRDAQVSRVGYVIDPVRRTMSVELDLPNPDGRLRPGMNGRVAIDLETHPDVLTADGWAIDSDSPGNSYCYRVVDGRAIKTKVITFGNSTDRKEIKGELSEGDTIIVEVLQSEAKPRAHPRNLNVGVRVEVVDKYD